MSMRRRLKRLEEATAKRTPHACRIELVEDWDGADLPPLPPCPECDRRGLIRCIIFTRPDGSPDRPLCELVSS